ncbi:MAG: hypothetical protein HYU43_06435, partial [Armatimonadetes bacterium]|nr:hypothetical protein [Armatimonadota bacterium]
PEELQRMDAVLFLNIPAVAVYSAQRFQLRDYVQGGGGFLLAGGQWAFGKGLTAYTVLEDVLPVTVVQNVDVHFFETHAALEPGPDAAEMFPKDLDWSPGPLVECYNEVAIKDGAKVFLQCGSVPILAGWTFGRGRVLAFLACAMGSAPARRQMFWEWPEWPRVAAAMLQWLAPDFRQTQSAERMESGQSPADEKKLEEIVERLTLSGEAELGAAEGPSGRAGSESSEASEALDVALPGGGETARASGPIEQDLATLSRCLSRSKLTPELARSCADAAVITLARTEGVSESVRESVLAAAARYPNPEWAAAAQPLLQKMDPEIKGLGYRITAISGADGAAQSVAKGLQDPDDLVRIDVLLALASSDSPAAVPEVAAVLERIDRSERDREAGQVFNDLNPWTLQVSWEEELMRMASIFYLYRAGKDAHAERQAYATLRMRYYLKVMDRHIAGIYAGMFNQPRSVVVSMQRLARQAEWVRRNMARLHEKQVEQVLSDGPHQLERFAPALTRAHWLDEVRLALQIAAAAVDARNFRAVSPLLEAKNRVLRTLALQQILSRGDEQDLKKALEKLQGMADRTGEEDLLFCLEHIGM